MCHGYSATVQSSASLCTNTVLHLLDYVRMTVVLLCFKAKYKTGFVLKRRDNGKLQLRRLADESQQLVPEIGFPQNYILWDRAWCPQLSGQSAGLWIRKREFNSPRAPHKYFCKERLASPLCYHQAMTIKTITWNIGGGKLLKEGSDPTRLASYSENGLDEIIGLLKKENADIITLQETQSNQTQDQVKVIADALGFNYVHDSTSSSHIEDGFKLGHAVITRYQIIDRKFGLFVNPNIEIEWEDGSAAKSFDKGYTTCTLDIDGHGLKVTTLHLVPFRRFEIDIHSDTAKTILRNVEDTIAEDYSSWLIQGDFNVDSEQLKGYLPKLFDKNTGEILLKLPTTPKGRKYDHIIFRDLELVSFNIESSVLTDHFPVIANFNFS